MSGRPSPMPGPWLYVDDRRTHEVRVQLKPGSAIDLVFREAALGAKDEKEAWTRTVQLGEPWERQMQLLALERRLTLLGNYYRAEAGKPGWAPVRQAGPVRALDLRPTKGRGEAIEFHVYREPEKDRTRTLVGMPRDTPAGPRYLLGRFDQVGKIDEAPLIQIVHSNLPVAVYRSMLAAEVLAAFDDRMSRTETAQHDEGWWTDVMKLVDGLVSAVKLGTAKQGEWRPVWKRETRLSAAQQRAADMGGTRAYEVEDEDTGGGASAVEAKKPSINIEEVPDDVFAILRDPRLIGLRGRFLGPGEPEALMGSGERELRQAMAKKRSKARPDEWHLLSLIEASLLVQRALAVRGARIEPETLHVLRHAPAYL